MTHENFISFSFFFRMHILWKRNDFYAYFMNYVKAISPFFGSQLCRIITVGYFIMSFFKLTPKTFELPTMNKFTKVCIEECLLNVKISCLYHMQSDMALFRITVGDFIVSFYKLRLFWTTLTRMSHNFWKSSHSSRGNFKLFILVWTAKFELVNPTI